MNKHYQWVPATADNLPDYDTPVTWMQEDGITFFTDIDHDMSADDIERFLYGGWSNPRVRITHYLAEVELVFPTDEEIEDAWASHAHSFGSFKSWQACAQWLRSKFEKNKMI